MRSALLVSDMFGRGGDTRYLLDWSEWLATRNITSDIVLVDDLLPELYDPSRCPCREDLHRRITQTAAWERASSKLRTRITASSPDVVTGFSYGGYVAYGARDALAAQAVLVCISTTRLRYHLPIQAGPEVHAIFGADDPNRPIASGSTTANSHLSCIEVAGADHEVYRNVAACADAVNRALSSPIIS